MRNRIIVLALIALAGSAAYIAVPAMANEPAPAKPEPKPITYDMTQFIPDTDGSALKPDGKVPLTYGHAVALAVCRGTGAPAAGMRSAPDDGLNAFKVCLLGVQIEKQKAAVLDQDQIKLITSHLGLWAEQVPFVGVRIVELLDPNSLIQK